MKLIRKNIFETNSSSTHILVIYTKDKIQLPDKLRLDFGEFGWDYYVYTDTHSKASYIITLIYSMEDNLKEECLKKFESIMNNNNIQYTLPHEGSQDIYRDDYGNGYVDHGDEAYEWVVYLLNNEDKLFDFLFSDKSYVSTGNDNDVGYYIPGIGYISECEDEEWERKTKEMTAQGYIIDYKGN